MSTPQWFAEFERQEAMREERLDNIRAKQQRRALRTAKGDDMECRVVCSNATCPAWGRGTHWHPLGRIDTPFVFGFPDCEPLLCVAAKVVAEGRQHGCHYAEGICPECLEIAEAVLRAIFPKEPPLGAIVWMARAHSPRLWDEIDKRIAIGRSERNPAWSYSAQETEQTAMTAAYCAMPIWRVLWSDT